MRLHSLTLAFIPLLWATSLQAQIERIWLTHRTNDPSRIVISWESAVPGNSVVHYHFGTEAETTVTQQESETIHQVEIPLTHQDGAYHYRVETAGQSSAEATFKAYPTDELRVAIVGDWGYAKTNDIPGLYRDDVHLLLTAGDNVTSLHEKGLEGGKAFSALIDRQPALFRSTPFMPILGNHDKEVHPRGPQPPAEPVYDVNAKDYLSFFALPDDQWKWHFDIPTFSVRFLALDIEHIRDFGTTWQTCHAFDEASPQFQWFRSTMDVSKQSYIFSLMNEKQTDLEGRTKGLWGKEFRKGSALITGFGYFAERAELEGGLPYFNTCIKGDGDPYKDSRSAFFAREDNYLLLTFRIGADHMRAELKNLQGETLDLREIEERAGR